VVGLVLRVTDSGDLPFISVAPASAPVSLKLDGIGRCELLGTVATLVEARPTDCDDQYKDAVAAPDVYLLAYHLTDGWVGEVVLISLTIDDEGRPRFVPVLRTLADRSANVDSTAAPPAALVEFPGPDSVSGANPAWRAHVTMLFREHRYQFALDMQIMMG
jgi:hypothetical protein